MGNWLYNQGREGFLAGDIDWDADGILVVLVDVTYNPTSGTTDAMLTAIASGDRVATSGLLASKTTTDGVADAADVTFTSVTGNTVNSIVIYRSAATSGAMRLIAYIDSATGLPVAPNGGDITVQWDSGANRIFKL